MLSEQSMRQRGVTLLELVVSIAVFALILAAAAPSIGTWLDNTRIRNAAQSIQEGLQLARTEAVRRNQNISFYLVSLTSSSIMDNSCALSSSSGSWVVSGGSPVAKCATAPSTTTAPQIVATRTVNDSGGKVVVAAVQGSTGTTAGTSVTFNGFGRVVNADAVGRINVTGPVTSTTYRKLQIAITPAGGIRMCDPAVSDTKDPRKCSA